MFIVPADFHTEYMYEYNAFGCLNGLNIFYAGKTYTCHPSVPTYQPNTEVRPTARKLVHDVNEVLITDFGSYYLAKGCYLYYSSFQ